MFRRDAIGQRRFEKGLYGSENTLWIYLFDLPAYYLHDAVRIYRFHRSDSVTINSFKRPLCIMKGYAMTAELILQKIAEKNAQANANGANSAEPKFRVNDAHIAILYKMAAYYAKFGGEYKKMYEYLFKSLKFKFTKEALAMLILSPFPKSMILFLTKIRVWIYKKTHGE